MSLGMLVTWHLVEAEGTTQLMPVEHYLKEKVRISPLNYRGRSNYPLKLKYQTFYTLNF